MSNKIVIISREVSIDKSTNLIKLLFVCHAKGSKRRFKANFSVTKELLGDVEFNSKKYFHDNLEQVYRDLSRDPIKGV